MSERDERDALIFRVNSWTLPAPGAMATCAMVFCMGCRKILHHRGGGGDFICMACHDLIRGGALRDGGK
jgi:LSD1 subclass zinc finger protein